MGRVLLNSGMRARRPSVKDTAAMSSTGMPDVLATSSDGLLTWVGDYLDRAEQVLEAEQARPKKDQRRPLVATLTDIILA